MSPEQPANSELSYTIIASSPKVIAISSPSHSQSNISNSNTTSPLQRPPTMSFLDSLESISEGSQRQSPPLSLDANAADSDISTPSSAIQTPDVDPQILEALKSKDRIYVLKLGEMMEGLINEHRHRIELSPATSYQRLLVHRCSAYYKLAPENDSVTKGIIVLTTVESRIPARRICELVPAEATAQPAFKIMRRSQIDRRSKTQSQAGSVAGEDADLSDVEPSESGSIGSRSNATGISKKRMTIEEREAAYNEARSRIFMGFEEKEKEKDMSASSSSLSLVSSANGSVGDVDEPVSSPATESEWSSHSGPVTRDKRRGISGNASASSSSRSLRSVAPSFHGNGSSSSRNSRAASPSFTYATIYEPPPPAPMYDPSSQHPNQVGQGYHPSQYVYAYNSNGQPPNPPYMGPYPYYHPFNPSPYQQPPHPHSNPPESPPGGTEQYPPIRYNNHYIWPHPAQPPTQPGPAMNLPPQPIHQNTSHPMSPVNAPQSPQYQPYMPQTQHAYSYPMNTYYPPGQQPLPLAPPQPHMRGQQPVYDIPRPANGSLPGNYPQFTNNLGGRPGLGNGVMIPSNTNSQVPRSGLGPGFTNGSEQANKSRMAPPMPQQARPSWSYGPGVGMGGYTSSVNGSDIVGPRLSTSRRQHNNSGSSNNSRASSNCDEVSSTASSSTTSSSSRRTYTSTASSQHPLPPRPDWAVGLKPQPTLAGRHHDPSLSNSRNMSPISPPRPLNGGSPHPGVSPRQNATQQLTSPNSLQSTDFPPLSTMATPEKRTPVITGAWGNPPSTRAILSPSPGHLNTPNNALIQPSPRPEESERGFERPAPKSAELYNPKVVRRPLGPNINGTGKSVGDRERDRARGDAVANAILVEQVSAITLEEDADAHRESSPFSISS